MENNINSKLSISKLSKFIIIALLSVYALITLVNQQNKMYELEKYKSDVSAKIAEQQQKSKNISRDRLDRNSDAFIEQIARDKLGFVKDNERIFIDGASR